MSDSGSRTLGCVLYEGFELLDVYGPLEMFAWVGEDLELVTVASSAGPVSPVKGPSTIAEYGLDDCPALDMVLVPGGVGTFAALEDQALVEFLTARAEQAEVVMSVCTGAALLAAAGLLDGRRATTNKQFYDTVTVPFPDVDWVTEARWVDDGDRVTSSGVSAGMDMALAVIERRYGAAKAEQVGEFTEYERSTDADHDPFIRCLNDLS